MKKSLLGSLIGLAVVVAADTIIRVVIALTTGQPVTLFRYEMYDGFIWAVIISGATFFTSFAGGALTVTYADEKKRIGLASFGLLLILVRYAQIHYVMEIELLFPMISLFLSLLSLFFVWKFFFRKNKSPAEKHEQEEGGRKKHHETDTTPW